MAIATTTSSVTSTRFHGYSDTVAAAGQMFTTSATTTVDTVTLSRELSYRFHAHFHPFVDELVMRLIEESVRGLQDADTDYAGNPDGTLKPRPNSTVGALAANTQVKLPGGAVSVKPKNTPVTVVDGTLVLLSNGKRALLPGDLILTEPRGLRVTVPAGGTETIPFGVGVKLVADALVRLSDGSVVTLPNNTELTLSSCKPLPKLYARIFTSPGQYNPSALVAEPYPVKDLDFTSGGAYSVYNWELFFHIPITIAIHLSRNQRFEDAMRWFHLVFDPTDDSKGPTPERFWKFKPFQFTAVKLIEEILINLSTGADAALREETVNSIRAWKDAPFRPHLVARYRQPAYMFKAVMAYLDNLIAWGDVLFQQDTGETINEATQLYVLAANILGPRPQVVPKRGSAAPRTYDSLKKDLNEFGNAMVNLETDIPFDLLPHPDEGRNFDQFTTTLSSIGHAPYFCVPRNDKLLGYWDTVADRLFKIRNSLNILGSFRQLPLFEPPIDPALLARAAAAGVDVAAIVNGLNQPLPLVRFQTLVRHAAEIVQEVKSLGNALLSAMEKEDGEAMAILRAKHERVVMAMVEQVRYGQVQEAIKSKEALFKSLALARQRYIYYERQLGRKPDEIVTEVPGELDRDSLARMNLTTSEPEVETREIAVDIAPDLTASDGRLVSRYEHHELEELQSASIARTFAAELNMVAKLMALIPEFGAHVQPVGVGATIGAGGRLLTAVLSFAADYHNIQAEEHSYAAGFFNKVGGHARREQDWAFQSNLAAGEITQIFKQIRAAEIREAVADMELRNHRQQMKHAEEIERFLNEEGTDKAGKKTNKAFYAWMKREVKGLYGQCFQFAFDIARKAERALQHELGNPELRYLQFGYLAGKEGLLAGEKLYVDVKRMEMAYDDLNQREYELTKHVSLLQVDPVALLKLRLTGSCTVQLLESLFDIDGPGHYFRRIKTVSVSIPCVAGPYASVNCTLTLLKSSIRTTQILRGGKYPREDAEDSRFSDYFGSLQSIVTSSAQNDSGLFETNLSDARYLPFENSGAISEWKLQLPANPSKAEPQQFDYGTISDVILHLRYTAREGGGLLRNAAMDHLTKVINEGRSRGSVRLFSVRQEFPTEWERFTSAPANQFAPLTLQLSEAHYPFWSPSEFKLKHVAILAKVPNSNTKSSIAVVNQVAYDPLRPQRRDVLTRVNNLLGSFRSGSLDNIPLPSPVGEFTLYFDDNSMEDLWLELQATDSSDLH